MNRPTPFAHVNAVLNDLHAGISSILGSNFVGMYVVGSLALGDFDHNSSDLDLVVVTDTAIRDKHFLDLQEMHARFDDSGSVWAATVEAVYASRNALCANTSKHDQYPQIEKGTFLFKAPLESGWAFQCHTLRQYALVVSGPDPVTLVDPVDSETMRAAVAEIAGLWLEQARHDPEWVGWVRQRPHQIFVIQTLCRMLFSCATGDVASKPAATQWAQAELGQPWSALIAVSVDGRNVHGDIPETTLVDTIAFIEYTVERSQAKDVLHKPQKGSGQL